MNLLNLTNQARVESDLEQRAGASHRRAGRLFQKDLTLAQRKVGLIAVLSVIVVAVVVLFVFF